MDKIVSALYFLAVLSVLVLVHEWGHFIVAKLCGMRVDDFSLFFWKRLIIPLGERNGTEYNIRSVPLGEASSRSRAWSRTIFPTARRSCAAIPNSATLPKICMGLNMGSAGYILTRSRFPSAL